MNVTNLVTLAPVAGATALYLTMLTAFTRAMADGIPTPEPAAPQRDLQLAGPTPQIPIPGGGYAGIPAN